MTPSTTSICDNLQHLSVHTPLYTKILSHGFSCSSGNTTTPKREESALQENNINLSEISPVVLYSRPASTACFYPEILVKAKNVHP